MAVVTKLCVQIPLILNNWWFIILYNGIEWIHRIIYNYKIIP